MSELSTLGLLSHRADINNWFVMSYTAAHVICLLLVMCGTLTASPVNKYTCLLSIPINGKVNSICGHNWTCLMKEIS